MHLPFHLFPFSRVYVGVPKMWKLVMSGYFPNHNSNSVFSLSKEVSVLNTQISVLTASAYSDMSKSAACNMVLADSTTVQISCSILQFSLVNTQLFFDDAFLDCETVLLPYH